MTRSTLNFAGEGKRCWAEIDLAALRHNVGVVRRLIGGHAGVMAIIKANAYGHGLREMAAALEGEVEMFGVASVAEARVIRESLPKAEIFILGAALPWERDEIVASGFIPSVSSLEEAALFNEAAGTGRVRVHLAIDTGMGRMGVWQDDALEVARGIIRLPRIEIAGIATHLPSADEDEGYTADQLARFEEIAGRLRGIGIGAPLIHALNSAGVIRFGGHAQGMVRAGLMLYGVSPVSGFENQLRPVMTLKTRVILVREVAAGRSVSYGRSYVTPRAQRVATLAIGYADGYPRNLSGHGAAVLIHGSRCPVLGRVTMDQIMADVTALENVVPGDEAVLIGRQGDLEIPAAELAEKAGTIVWEIFTGLKGRVERIYLHATPSFAKG
jgi:alanine racemase